MLNTQVQTTRPAYVSPEYVSTADVNKAIRVMLKKAFPGVKFSVTKDGGCTYVRWEGSPSEGDVRDLVGFMHGDGFDGMIDMRYSHYHYRLADGSYVYGGTDGTTGSGGCYAPEHYPAPEGAVKVRLMNDFIFFTNRQY